MPNDLYCESIPVVIDDASIVMQTLLHKQIPVLAKIAGFHMYIVSQACFVSSLLSTCRQTTSKVPMTDIRVFAQSPKCSQRTYAQIIASPFTPLKRQAQA